MKQRKTEIPDSMLGRVRRHVGQAEMQKLLSSFSSKAKMMRSLESAVQMNFLSVNEALKRARGVECLYIDVPEPTENEREFLAFADRLKSRQGTQPFDFTALYRTKAELDQR